MPVDGADLSQKTKVVDLVLKKAFFMPDYPLRGYQSTSEIDITEPFPDYVLAINSFTANRHSLDFLRASGDDMAIKGSHRKYAFNDSVHPMPLAGAVASPLSRKATPR